MTLSADIDGTPAKCLYDTGAVITVLKRNQFQPKTPPKSRLKLKGVLPGTSSLYGPRMTDLKINNKVYRFPAYEADIEEDCILGLNFMRAFHCVADPVKMTLVINHPEFDEIPLNPTQKTPSISFHTGTVYFTVRLSHPTEIYPGRQIKINTDFKADCDVTSSRLPPQPITSVRKLFTDYRDDTDSPSSSSSRRNDECATYTEDIEIRLPDETSDMLERGVSPSNDTDVKQRKRKIFMNSPSIKLCKRGRSSTLPRENVLSSLNSPNDTQEGQIPKKKIPWKGKPDTQDGNTLDGQTSNLSRNGLSFSPVSFSASPLRYLQFGYLTNPSAQNTVAANKLQVSTGIIPCITAPLQFTITNTSNNRLVLPKQAVLAEVHPLSNNYIHEVEILSTSNSQSPAGGGRRKQTPRRPSSHQPTDFSSNSLQDIPLPSSIPVDNITSSSSQQHSLFPASEIPLPAEMNEINLRHIATTSASPVLHEYAPYFDAEINTEPRVPSIPPDQPLPSDLAKLLNGADSLTDAQKTTVETTLRKHHDVFVQDKNQFGTCQWLKFRIDTQGHAPIKQPARPIPIHYRQAVYDQIMNYIKSGTLVPSQSPWASPIVCVKKNGNEVRVCADFRCINARTRVSASPIPRVEELLQKIAGRPYQHSFDLANGYHCVLIHPEDRPKTSIILPDELGLPHRQLEYVRLPFGLAAAPSQFQVITDRLMMPAKIKTPENDIGSSYAVYLDDIAISGDGFEEMLQKLCAFFNRVRAAGFLLKASKCSLFKKIIFLGHSVDHRGISVDKDKIQRILH